MAEKRRIPKNVIWLGIVSFFTDISSEMIYPIIPLFLRELLHAPVTAIGLIEGVAEATASLLKVFSGYLSDIMKRRKVLVVIGYSISNIAKPLMGFSTHWLHVFIAKVSDRIGKGIRTSPRDALIAESADQSVRGTAFGLHRTLDTLGAILGPLITFTLFAAFHYGYRTVFYLTAIPGAIAVLVLLIFVKEPQRKLSPEAEKSRPKLSLKGFSTQFKIFLLFSIIFAIGNSSDTFIILRARNIGFSTSSTVGLYMIFNIVYAIFATPMGTLSDRIPRKNVLGMGYIVFALVYLGLAVAGSKSFVLLLFAVYGLYYAMVEGVGRAIVADFVPQERLGTAYGIYHTAMGLSLLPASLIAGVLWDKVGAYAPFAYGAITSAIAAVGILTFVKSQKEVG